MSRGLAALVRDGVAGGGARLDTGGLRPALQRLAPGQSITRFEYEGDAIETEALWLGHNRMHAISHSRSWIGSRGMVQLGQALSLLDPPLPLPANPDLATLAQLAGQIRGEGLASRRAAQIIDVLQISMKTLMFLREFMPRALSSAALDQALARLDLFGVPDSAVPDDHELVSETDFVEHVALRRCGQAFPAERSLAYFVAGLAFAVGTDPNAPFMQSWASGAGAAKHLNDAMVALYAVEQRQRLRLIVSLHPSATGEAWPDSLDIWLLDAGADPKRHPNTLVCLHNLSVAVRVSGNKIQAWELARRAAAGLHDSRGQDHPYTLSSQMNLGICQAETDEAVTAAEVLRETANRLSEVLGPDHPNTLRCRGNQALVARMLNLPDAEDQIATVVARLQRIVGRDHPITVALRDRVFLNRIIDLHPF